MSIPPNQLGDLTAEAGTSSFVVSGTLAYWPSNLDPSGLGWVVCDGTSYSQTNPTFSNLFTIIGTTFNNPGDPAGTFRVPDLVSRVAVGYGNIDPNLDICGNFGVKDGSGGIQIPAEALPPHIHQVNGDPPGVLNSLGLGSNAYQSLVDNPTLSNGLRYDGAGTLIGGAATVVKTRNPYLSIKTIIKL